VRTLLIDLDPQWRGGQNQGFILLGGLRARGHRPELLAPAGAPMAERAARDGFAVHTVPASLARYRAAAPLRRLLAEQGYAVVHANEPHGLTAAWLAGAHRRVPVVVSRRVAYPLGTNPLARRRYRAVRYVLAISQFVAASCRASGVEEERIRLLYEGVEIPALPSAEERNRARARWSILEEENLLGCVGYLLPEKGQETLLRALPEVRKAFPAVRLLLAGDGPCRGKLERLRSELQLGSAVILPGVVEEITEVYRAMDVFLFPSLAEPLGTSLLVAMAYALPVVASQGGAGPEVLEEGVSGYLRPPGDAPAWADAIRRLLADRAAATRLGAAARETISERFSADRMVEQTLQVYRELAGPKETK
jgi:glycosyltransferase involved in cell wall biosynthesis